MTALCLVLNLGSSSVKTALLAASGVNRWQEVAATLRLMRRSKPPKAMQSLRNFAVSGSAASASTESIINTSPNPWRNVGVSRAGILQGCA